MKLWQWQKGRQENTEYWKFPLWYFKIWKWGFDAYILKYAPGTVLPVHKDPITNGKHWRINIKLKGIATFLICKPTITANVAEHWQAYTGILTLFRPDLYEHSLVVEDKECIKLSFGLVKFN